MIPNYLSEVEACKAESPEAWKSAHTGNAHTEDFIKLLAARIAAFDPKCGLNGKRGDPNDLSDDALNYLCSSTDSTGRTPEGLPCVVIDVIGSAGSTSAYPTWQVFSQAPEANGAWVKPGPVVPTPQPPQPPMPTQPPGREEALNEMQWLDAYYASPEGLQRPNGLSVNGKPDFEGIAAWYLDIYQRERMAMKSRADARAAYVNQIRHSDEWKAKHPGETP